MSVWNSKLTLWSTVGMLGAGLGALAWVFVAVLQPASETSADRAAEEMHQRRFHQAVASLTRVIQDEPESVDALVNRGTCYLKTRQYTNARQDFERALQLKPELPAAELGLAEVLLGEGKHDEARAAAQKVANADPRLAAPYAVIGKVHYSLFERGAHECVRILEENPRDPLAAAAAADVRSGRFDSSEKYWANRLRGLPAAADRTAFRIRLDAAKQHFALAVANLKIGCGQTKGRRGTADPDTWLLLSAILLEKGDGDEAMRTADKALALPGADRVRAAIIKAEVLGERAGRLTDQYAEQGLKHLPSVEAHYVRGIVDLAKGEYGSAASEFIAISDKMQNEPRLHFNLGLAYYRRGGATTSVTLAGNEFKRVIDLRPNFVPARLRLAKLYLRRGLYDDVREQCERILHVPARPQRVNTQVYLMLSLAHRGLKDYDQALLWLDRAATEEPSADELVAQTLFLLAHDMEDQAIRKYVGGRLPAAARKDPTYPCVAGYALVKKGMWGKAIEYFKQARLLDGQYIMGYVHLAHTYELQDRVDDAAKQYEEAIKMLEALKLPENMALFFGLGRLRVGQKRFADAEKQFKKVLAMDSKHVPARLRLAALRLRDRKFRQALADLEFVIERCRETAEARYIAGLIYSACVRRPEAVIRAEIEERRKKAATAGAGEVSAEDIDAERRLWWRHAVENYEQAIDLNQGLRFSYELALIYALDREFQKMASVYERVLSDPERPLPARAKPRIMRRLAIAYLGAELADKAVNAAREAVQLSIKLDKRDLDDVVRNQFTLIHCLIAQGEFAKAQAMIRRTPGAVPGLQGEYTKMIRRLRQLAGSTDVGGGRRAPGRLYRIVGLELNLGLLFSRAGVAWLPEAERVYRGLIARDGKNVAAMRYLGDLYLATSRLDGAEDRLKKAEKINRRILDLSPLSPLALRNLAAIEEQRTRAAAAAKATPQERLEAQAEAVKLYESAIRAAPAFWLPHLELASLYQRAGLNDKALKLYKRVILLNPRPVWSLNNYADLSVEEQENLDRAVRDRAAEYARRARNLDPYSGAVADALGRLYTILSPPEKAIEQLEQGRCLLPDHPTVRYHLAVAGAKVGKKAEALSLLEGLLKSGARFPERAQAVQLRDTLKKELGAAP